MDRQEQLLQILTNRIASATPPRYELTKRQKAVAFTGAIILAATILISGHFAMENQQLKQTQRQTDRLASEWIAINKWIAIKPKAFTQTNVQKTSPCLGLIQTIGDTIVCHLVGI